MLCVLTIRGITSRGATIEVAILEVKLLLSFYMAGCTRDLSSQNQRDYNLNTYCGRMHGGHST